MFLCKCWLSSLGVGHHDPAKEFFKVWRSTKKHGIHPLLFKQQLDLSPDPLDGVELGTISHHEDNLDLVLLRKLCDSLAVMDAAVVLEDSEFLRTRGLEDRQKILDEGFCVDRVALDVVRL